MMLWFKKLICRWRGHKLEPFDACSKCTRCGKVQMSRAQLLKELLPALNLLFDIEYSKQREPKLKEQNNA
jgi:hypothetical protein